MKFMAQEVYLKGDNHQDNKSRHTSLNTPMYRQFVVSNTMYRQFVVSNTMYRQFVVSNTMYRQQLMGKLYFIEQVYLDLQQA
jgi:hypothetical protein